MFVVLTPSIRVLLELRLAPFTLNTSAREGFDAVAAGYGVTFISRSAIEGELAQRRYGAAVRLETSLDCPEDITSFLLRHFALKRDDLYQVNGPVNLNRLMAIYDLVDRPDLKYPAFTPCIPKRLVAKEDIFAVMRESEVLLHHPFESFEPVVQFLASAGAVYLLRSRDGGAIIRRKCESM